MCKHLRLIFNMSVNTSEEPIVEYCVKFLDAINRGDIQSLYEQWHKIQSRRLQIGKRTMDFWQPVYNSVQARRKFETRVAQLIISIRDNEEPNVQKTSYYSEALRKQNLQLGSTGNPYLVFC